MEIAVLGAGPVGLEAAAAAGTEGHSVMVFEQGEVAQHVMEWAHVRLFTPFGMNAGPEGARLLRASGTRMPEEGDMQTGHQFRERYLLPLAAALSREARLELGATVVSVGRNHLLKGELIGRAERAGDGFRLLVDDGGGERAFYADVVLDCTGTYGMPGWLGPGGTPAVGERALRASIEYGLPDVLGADRDSYAGMRTLVIGDGYSAATTVLALARLGRAVSGTSFLWATREEAGCPLAVIDGDTLEARSELVSRANSLALDPPEGCEWQPGLQVAGLERDGASGKIVVRLESRKSSRREAFDRVVANVGYEPDDSLYRQLQIHECYASRGPMNLSAALLAAQGDGPADCLAVGGLDSEVLRNPEPGYFILGMKSFGKGSAFLLRTGYQQVRDVMALIGRENRIAAPA